ncbi:hypothetical protein L596_010721 [Steinernema carpocapsae]|uniref:Uncharacterized protein n=1 Tax=Steinernema carpocapsae TaxID=34508 RepID=A0A4U5PJP3_STECR|nr:hypothetical protein L596_010721 [Steinernema carpocapsae]
MNRTQRCDVQAGRTATVLCVHAGIRKEDDISRACRPKPVNSNLVKRFPADSKTEKRVIQVNKTLGDVYISSVMRFLLARAFGYVVQLAQKVK